MKTLFIVASGELKRKYPGPGADAPTHFVLGENVLLAIPEPPDTCTSKEDRDKQFTKPVVDVIRRMIPVGSPCRLRVAGHTAPCFGMHSDNLGQVHAVEHEQDLKKELQQVGFDRDLDLIVCAFHHEDDSPIWYVVDHDLKNVMGGEATDQAKEAFVSALLDAFITMPVYERLSVLRHRVLHLLLPLDLKLQRSEEAARDCNLKESQDLVMAVNSLLPDRISQATELLERGKHLIQDRKDEQRGLKAITLYKGIVARLKSPPSLTVIDYHHWIGDLKKGFDALRELFHERT